MIYIIIAISLVLRLVNLNQSLWLDEAVQAITAKGPFLGIFEELRGDFHPPLYHILLWGWVRIFGASEVSLRMPSVIFGVGTVGIVYLIMRGVSDQRSVISNQRAGVGERGLLKSKSLAPGRWSPVTGRRSLVAGRWLPILGAVFLATAPLHIYYSQEARMYGLATFLTAGSAYFFLRILKDDKGWLKDGKGVGYFLFTLLALYTDYYVFLVLLAQMTYLAIKKKFKPLILYSLFIILCYLPWVPMLITQVKVGMLATQSLPGWEKLVNVSFLKALPLTFVKFSLGRINIFDKKLYGIVAVGLIAGYGWLMIKGIRGWFKETKGHLKDKLGDFKGMVIMWFFIPLLISWVASLFIPNYQPFRLLLILPAFYLLLVFGIWKINDSMIQIIVSSIIVIINVVSCSIYFFNPYFQREDWRGVVSYLKTQPDAVAVLPSETSAWPIKYYDPEQKIDLVSVAKDVGVVGGIGEIGGDKESQIYYIRYLVPLFDPNERILAKLEEQGYTKVKEISFNQIPLLVYRRDQ